MDKLISQLGATAGVVSTDVFELEKLAGPPSEKATIAQLITLLDTLYASSDTAPAAGAGSPEGVVTGAPGKPYTDTVTGDFWTKQTGTGNTGWLQLIAA